MVRYKKDDAISKFQVLEAFKQYTSNVLILQYINEFEKCPNKVKIYGGDMPDSVLAYRFLKNTNLKQTKEQLIKVTINNSIYSLMKDQRISLLLKHSFITRKCRNQNRRNSSVREGIRHRY